MLEKAKAAHQNRVEERTRKKAEREEQRRLKEEAERQRLEEERLQRVEEARLKKEAEEQRIQKRREELSTMDIKDLLVENTLMLEELTRKLSEVHGVSEYLKLGPQPVYDDEGYEIQEESPLYLFDALDHLYDGLMSDIDEVRSTVWEASSDN